MNILKNQKGNTILFIVGLFSVFFLMFVIVISFANVFIKKEQASNNAEQASIVASGIILDSLEEAIDDYDGWLIPLLASDPIPLEAIGLEPLGDKVDNEKDSLPSTYTESERKHKAINSVLKEELPGNDRLKTFVSSNLADAEGEIYSQVQSNILSNNGELSQTEINFTDNRVEVKTATRFEALKYDEYFSESQRYVKQKGRGPTFEFADSISWSLSKSY